MRTKFRGAEHAALLNRHVPHGEIVARHAPLLREIGLGGQTLDAREPVCEEHQLAIDLTAAVVAVVALRADGANGRPRLVRTPSVDRQDLVAGLEVLRIGRGNRQAVKPNRTLHAKNAIPDVAPPTEKAVLAKTTIIRHGIVRPGVRLTVFKNCLIVSGLSEGIIRGDIAAQVHPAIRRRRVLAAIDHHGPRHGQRPVERQPTILRHFGSVVNGRSVRVCLSPFPVNLRPRAKRHHRQSVAGILQPIGECQGHPCSALALHERIDPIEGGLCRAAIVPAADNGAVVRVDDLFPVEDERNDRRLLRGIEPKRGIRRRKGFCIAELQRSAGKDVKLDVRRRTIDVRDGFRHPHHSR